MNALLDEIAEAVAEYDFANRWTSHHMLRRHPRLAALDALRHYMEARGIEDEPEDAARHLIAELTPAKEATK